MILNDQPYWLGMAHGKRGLSRAITNNLLETLAKQHMTLETFFHLSERDWAKDFALKTREREALKTISTDLKRLASWATTLNERGIVMIPCLSDDYPAQLRMQLGAEFTPTLLYAYGDTEILKQPCVAIVGSRNPANISLQFTESVVRHAIQQRKVVVSGLAKGIDRHALEICLRNDWPSIAVLPMGMLRTGKLTEQYVEHVKRGKLLLASICAPWEGFGPHHAMARNAIILGMAEEVFVPQSGLIGGTWEGVRQGLKQGRRIAVRVPTEGEQVGNLALIALGAKAMEFK